MKITNQHVETHQTPDASTKPTKLKKTKPVKTEKPKPTKEPKSRIWLWVSFLCFVVVTVVGILSFMAYRVNQATNTGDTPVFERSETAQVDTDIEQQINLAVDEALTEQQESHQSEVDALKSQIAAFEGDDIAGYQTQIDELTAERESLLAANEELTGVNQALSDSNAELSERTTVTDIQTAYEEQIAKLESDNEELTSLLEQVRERLEQSEEDGQ